MYNIYIEPKLLWRGKCIAVGKLVQNIKDYLAAVALESVIYNPHPINRPLIMTSNTNTDVTSSYNLAKEWHVYPSENDM